MLLIYVNIIGWVGFFFIILGYYLNSKKQINCFYSWAIGNIIFMIYAYLISSYPMLYMSFFTFLMNCYGYKKWGENK